MVDTKLKVVKTFEDSKGLGCGSMLHCKIKGPVTAVYEVTINPEDKNCTAASWLSAAADVTIAPGEAQCHRPRSPLIPEPLC